MTLNQIEEVIAFWREKNEHLRDVPLSLQQACLKVHLGFRQCETCRGNGYTKVTNPFSIREMQALAEASPRAPIETHLQYERCPRCDGAGGFVQEAFRPNSYNYFQP